MPFHKYSIEPVRLGRKPLPPDKNVDDQLEAVANNTLIEVLHQLSSLIKNANVIFNNVSAECQKLNTRATNLKKRVNDCEVKANDLKAKRVSIPVGDLASFSLVRHHFKTNYSIDTSSLFLESNRPGWVKERYSKVAEPFYENEPGTSGRDSNKERNSYPLQRFLEHYYWNDSELDEEQKAYRYIVCRPVIGDSKWRAHLDIETRKPARLRKLKEEKAATRAKNLQRSYDVLNSSTSDSFRDDSLELQELDGFDDDFPDLPSPEERLIALSMEYPSTVVSVDVSGRGFQRMTTLRRSLIHGDFLIKRKKKKRRNTICEGANSKDSKNSHTKSIQTDAEELRASTSSGRLKESSQIQLSNKDFPPVRFRGNRRSYVQNERSSLYASVDIIGPKVEKKKRYSMDPKALSSVNNSHIEEEVTKKGSKKGRVRSLLPISTLSAAMTVAVKLRGGLKDAVNGNSKGKGRKEEGGQSSSGNWSATSSIRGSVIESVDAQRLPDTSEVCSSSETSRSSVEKDSVLSDTTGGSKKDFKTNGYASDISNTASNTENLTSQATSGGTVRKWNDSGSDRSGTLTPEHNGPNTNDSSSTPRMLSPKFVHRRRYSGSQHGPGSITNDDESESVYSVDTDGYYTSMHTDSGLKNMSPKRKEEHYGKPVCRRESTSSVSTIGNISVNSILSRSAFETGPNQSSTIYREPPIPPPRVTSMLVDKSPEINNNKFEVLGHSKDLDLPPPPPSPPESDAESREKRLQQKTKISSTHYPFMCAVSPESSDEERKANVDALDSVLRNNVNSFVPLGFNMYGDISAPKNNLFGVTLPDTPPYTPNEESVLSSFASSKPANTCVKAMDYKSKIIPPSPLASPTPNQPVVILKTSNQKTPMIPLKYAQHITVTPMSRSARADTSDNWSSNESTSSSGGVVTGVVKARVSPFIIRAQPIGRKSPVDAPLSGKSTLERPAAKVTLDSDGKVIFSSNSLGRRRDNHPMNYLHLSPTKMAERKWATLPTRLGQNPSTRSASPIMSPTRFGYSSLPRQTLHRSKSPYSSSSVPLQIHESTTENKSTNDNDLSRNLQLQISPESLSKKKPMSNEDLFAAIHNCKKKLNYKPEIEKSPASSRCNSPLSIKLKPNNSPFKKELPESGCLSPRKGALSPNNLSSGYSSGRSTPNSRAMAIDRLGTNKQTSLRDFKLLLSQTGTSSPVSKKSAIELLKANVSANNSPRSLPGSPYRELNNGTYSSTVSRPISVTPTPISSNEWGGHSTVPFKRGARGRLSLQTRYDGYNCPPIMEDCSEEGENDRGRSPKRDFHFTPISRELPSNTGYHRGIDWQSPPKTVTMGLNTTPIKPSTSTWV